MTRTSRSARYRLMAVGLALGGLVAGCADRRGDFVEQMKANQRTLELPMSIQFVDERVAGNLGDCIQTQCLHVTRYYTSDLDPIAACGAMEAALRAWATDVRRAPDVSSPGPGCRFEGMKDEMRLSVGAATDIPIEAGDGHTDEVAVRQPHGSIITVRLETS